VVAAKYRKTYLSEDVDGTSEMVPNSSTALEEVLVVLRIGMDKGQVGAKRKNPLICGGCSANVFAACKPEVPTLVPPRSVDLDVDDELTICNFCNCWLHPSCAEGHISKHVPGLICRGVRRERESEAKRQKLRELDEFHDQLVEELEQKADEEPPAEEEKDDDVVITTAPDPMGEFFATRKSLRRGNRDLLPRCDSSHSLGLSQQNYCTSCGSSDCFQKPDLCKEARTDELRRLLLDGFFKRDETTLVSLWDSMPRTVQEHDLQEMQQYLLTAVSRQIERKALSDNQKSEFRTAAKKRQQGPAANMEYEAKREIKRLLSCAEGNSAQPGYATMQRICQHTCMSMGPVAKTTAKRLNDQCQRGREFIPGSAADSVLHAATVNDLHRAIMHFQSGTPEVFMLSKEFATDFMKKVTREQLAPISWALQMCQLILERFDAKLENLQAEELRAENMAPEDAEVLGRMSESLSNRKGYSLRNKIQVTIEEIPLGDVPLDEVVIKDIPLRDAPSPEPAVLANDPGGRPSPSTTVDWDDANAMKAEAETQAIAEFKRAEAKFASSMGQAELVDNEETANSPVDEADFGGPEEDEEMLEPEAASNDAGEDSDTVEGAVKAAARSLNDAWQTHQYALALEKVESGEYVCTYYALAKHFKKEFHKGRMRKLTMYGIGSSKYVKLDKDGKKVPSSNQRVAEMVSGADTTGRSYQRDAAEEDLEKGMALTPEEITAMSPAARKIHAKVEEDRKIRRGEADVEADKALLAAEEGSWYCNNCWGINFPGILDCPRFIHLNENPNARFGSGKFKICGGSQTTTWGG
jgi:hypothetical protein